MADVPCVIIKRCNSDWSCCGIVLDSNNGILLTVASLFSDNLHQNERQRTISEDSPILVSSMSPNDEIAVEVIFRSHTDEEFRTFEGYVILFWRDYGLKRITELIFPTSEWKFELFGHDQKYFQGASDEEHGNDTSQLHQTALSDFALIKVKNPENFCSSYSLVNLRTLRGLENPKIGDSLCVIGTPFGCECPQVFYNSVSKGIVSNVLGRNNEMIITDARCIPGCEGCALYTFNQKPGLLNGRDLYGIVLAPFCWRNGEWIGITLACSLWYIIHNLSQLLKGNISLIPLKLMEILANVLDFQVKIQSQQNVITEDNMLVYKGTHSTVIHVDRDSSNLQDIIKIALSSVVMVQCGNRWGSGVIIDSEDGLVVTCSHVVKDCQNPLIVTGSSNTVQCFRDKDKVKLCGNYDHSAYQKVQVLFATQEECPLDFALLKMQLNQQLKPLRSRLETNLEQRKSPKSFAKHRYKKGKDVLVIGFPLFASHLNTGASVVSGVISNIVRVQKQTVLLQSTAAVHCGTSGGALVSAETGELLGMVTSHVKDANMSCTFPHVNFSIPADLLYQLVSSVKDGTIENTLQALVSNDLKNVWQLEKNLSDKPQIISKL